MTCPAELRRHVPLPSPFQFSIGRVISVLYAIGLAVKPEVSDSPRGTIISRRKTPSGPASAPGRLGRRRLHRISGVFYIGLGDEFDASKLEAIPRRHDHSPWQHAPFSSGEIQRVHDASNRNRAARTGVPQGERRSAKQQLVGGVSFCGPKRTSFLILPGLQRPESRVLSLARFATGITDSTTAGFLICPTA